MDLIIALIYLMVCTFLLIQMVLKSEIESLQLGLIGLFSIGYCVLPVLFKPLSALRLYSDDEISVALTLHLVFLLCIIFGVAVGKQLISRSIGLFSDGVDSALYRYRYLLSFVSFCLFVAYFLENDLTSYSSGNFEEYFQRTNLFASILSTLSTMFVAHIAITFAVELKARRKIPTLLLGGAIIICVALSVSLAQRLAVITPLIILFAALVVTGQVREALKSLAVLVVVLILVSPFAVFLRQANVNVQGKERALVVGGEFNYGEDIGLSLLTSIIDRADLLENTVDLKHFIDSDEYVGWPFYYSVLIQPVPRLFFADKPYPLSSDGTMNGEISILAWHLSFGGIGSLTAFGGITAYREGGWLMVVLDGLATGVFFALVASWLGRGGWGAKIIYVSLFVDITVMRVPPSFFEALTSLIIYIPYLLLLFFAKLLPGSRAKTTEKLLTQ
jgi:hypothetical protein